MRVPVLACIGGASLVWCGIALAADGSGNAIADEWGEEVEGFSLSLRTPKREYLSGKPIPCVVVLKNAGPEARRIAVSSAFATWRLQVLLADGTPAPPTRRGKRSAEAAGRGSWSTRMMEPGDTHLAAFDKVNVLFDMTLSGEYQISASADVPKADARGYAQVTSNAVSIRVAESPTGDSGRWVRDTREVEELLEALGSGKEIPPQPPASPPATPGTDPPPAEPDSPVAPTGVPSPPTEAARDAQTSGSQRSWLIGIIGVLAGIGLGAVLAWALLRRRYGASREWRSERP